MFLLQKICRVEFGWRQACGDGCHHPLNVQRTVTFYKVIRETEVCKLEFVLTVLSPKGLKFSKGLTKSDFTHFLMEDRVPKNPT